MKGWLPKYVYLIPIIQIIATFVVSFFDLTEYQWTFLGNSVGYSVLTGIVYVILFWNPSFKYCWFTKISAIGLLIMAMINLIGQFLEFKDYIKYFDRAIFSIVLLMVFVLNNEKLCAKLLKKITT